MDWVITTFFTVKLTFYFAIKYLKNDCMSFNAELIEKGMLWANTSKITKLFAAASCLIME